MKYRTKTLCKTFRFPIQLKLGLYQSGSFQPASQTNIGLPPAVRMSPISAKTKKQQTSNEGKWVPRSGRGQLRETKSTSTAPPAATNRSTFSRQHRPKDLSILQGDIHLIKIKYCETLDRRTSWAPRRNSTKASAPSFKDPPLPSILLGVGGTIYSSNHTLEPLTDMGLGSKRVKSLLPSFMFILSITLPNLSISDVPFPALLPTLIKRRFLVKPATLLIPINLFLYFLSV